MSVDNGWLIPQRLWFRRLLLCVTPVGNWCLIPPCEWRGHLDMATVMAATIDCITAHTKRCPLSFSPLFTGHPIFGKAVFTKGSRDLSTINTRSTEDARIVTEGYDLHGDFSIVSHFGGGSLTAAALELLGAITAT